MKKKSESIYEELEGLKEVPELGADPEKVENTVLKWQTAGRLSRSKRLFRMARNSTSMPSAVLKSGEGE